MSLSDSLTDKLAQIRDRHEELGRLLSEPEIVSDREQFPKLSREYSELEPIVHAYEKYEAQLEDLAQANELADEDDEDLRELAAETIKELTPMIDAQVDVLQHLLLPKDPNDDANVFLEIRAGTGGDEAGLFSADLYNMYLAYANSNGWTAETISANPTGIGGYKQVIVRLDGRDVFSKLKFESGAHRVQRVPKTESQGRIHTSACTVASCRKARMKLRSKSINQNFESTPFELQARAVNMSTKLTRLFVLRICQPASSLNANRSDRKFRTGKKR